MTIRRITAADREAARLHAELRQVLDELWDRYQPHGVMTDDERARAIAYHRDHPDMSALQIDPYRRTSHR